MRRGHHCRCCGLGLALDNFSGVHSSWNFYSWVAGSAISEDEDGWTVAESYTLDPWSGSLLPIRPFRPRLNRFAYKVDEDAETYDLQIVIEMQTTSGLDWEWELNYVLTFADYEKLIADGRLKLNDYLTEATHSGVEDVLTADFDLLPTDTQDGWGDFVLVWPRFSADWAGKRLVVSGSTDTPIKNKGFSGPPINLAWLESPFEFVFDKDSLIEPTSGAYRPYYEDVQNSTDCYQFFSATHQDIATVVVLQTPAGVVAREDWVARLRFRTGNGQSSGNTCNGSQVDGTVAMDWQIGSVWWKAFENEGVVVTTEYKGLGRSASPVLHTQTPSNRQPLDEYDPNDFGDPPASVFPITYTLSLLPIE